MSDELNTGISIEFLLRQIDQTLNDKDIEAADRLLTEAKRRVQSGAPELREVQRQERALQALRNARVASVEDRIRRLLTQTPIPGDNLEKEIDQLQRLAPNHASLDAWRNALARDRVKQRYQLQFDALAVELSRMWQDADEAQQKGLIGQELIALYEHALERATSEAANIDLPAAKALVAQARERYEQVRKIHMVFRTRQIGEQYKALLDDLRQMDPSAHVLISEDLLRAAESQKYITAADAIKIVERQARDYAASKANEYRDRARKYLAEHSPKAADDELRKALELFALDEEERQKTVLLRSTQVKKDLDSRETAERKLYDAQVQGDPEKAWGFYIAAREADPYTPGIDEVRKNVTNRTKVYLDDRLNKAHQSLQEGDSPDFEGVLRIASDVRRLAGQDVEFKTQLDRAETLLVEAEAWKRLDGEIKEAINDAEMKKETQPHVVYEGLKARMAGWGDRARRFKALSDTIATLEARVNVTDLIARTNQAIRDQSIPGGEEVLRACDVAVVQNQPRQGELIEVRRRLGLHLKYLQGAILLRNPARTPADEGTGLKLLQEVIDNKGDDLKEAQELMSTVKRDRKVEEDAANALATGTRRLKEGRFAEAYALLQPYAARNEFAEPLEQATVAWEEQLLTQTRNALAAPRIDEAQARKWVETLEKLGSEHAAELRARVIGKSAAQRARDLEQLPNSKWADILAAWDEAVAAEPANTAYQTARQKADKQKAHAEMSGFSLENQVAELDELAGRYPTDLEVRLDLIDTLVKHLGVLRNLDDIERNVFRAQALIAQAEQMASGSDAARKVQSQLAEQVKTVQTALDIAQRKNEIEQQLRPDRLLDSWKRAKVQIDELLKDYPTRRDLVVWARGVRSEALRGAQERLKDKTTAGADVWDKVQPAAQVLILNEDNGEARLQIESAYQAVAILDSKQTALKGDVVGAAYSGDGRQSLVNQLADANTLRRKLMLAEQVLMLFGGFFRDPEGLRNKVKELQAQNNQLIEDLEQLQRYLAAMEAAILSARADDSENAWYPVDEPRKLIDKLGYGRHRAVLARDETKRQVQEKQKQLRDLRVKITSAILAGKATDALRLADLMRDPKDPMADPDDEYAEQNRFRVQEPYTRRSLTNLDDIIALLRAQVDQVAQLRAWLPLLPEAEPSAALSLSIPAKVNRPLVRWTQVVPGVHEALRKGAFNDARCLIDDALNGKIGPNGAPSGKIGEAIALNPAIDWLSKPIVAKASLNSAEAERLWKYSQDLLNDLLADRDAALRQRGEVDRLENQWQDAYQRFLGAVDVVRFEVSRPRVQKLRPSWRTEVASFKQTARVEFNSCMELCPEHPDLAGWANNPMLG